jgi:hypothetical protein
VVSPPFSKRGDRSGIIMGSGPAQSLSLAGSASAVHNLLQHLSLDRQKRADVSDGLIIAKFGKLIVDDFGFTIHTSLLKGRYKMA